MSRVVAELGPTNTGKTHRALSRMREHDTGMIGLPLRLLAREVYDRLVREESPAAVALVTGEERRIPARPRYWVCTVEAMPEEVEVDFLAIDEIQLAGHPERGHVFTDRLLHARGKQETWFLGSDSMVPLIERLVPGIEVRSSPRLSTLRSTGVSNLGGLPRRSAVIAFSAKRVYELAERIKARRGGVAIVLGALSPRARNSQVAMYQSGEVDYLVATDAIGMGLNLDLDHVAFSETRKFDGEEVRRLEIGELSQIAGRAGRYQNDGTFGTLGPERPLPPDVERAIEEHRIPKQRGLVWRSRELDFSSPGALLRSLDVPSPDPRLSLVHYAEDRATLEQLGEDADVASAATGEARVRLLWDLCQIPDYRQLLIEQHARLVGDLFLRLSRDGILDSDTLRSRIEPLRQHHGDIDSITARIAFIRTWTYVANHDEWVEDAATWQERTRAIEDELSDALHRALVESFVDRKRRGRPSPTPKPQGSLTKGHLEQLAALKAKLEGGAEPAGPSFAERLASAPFKAFSLDERGRIVFDGQRVGRLENSGRICQPRVRVEVPPDASDQAALVRQRLQRFERELAEDVRGRLGRFESERGEQASAAARGIVYQLEQGLGTAVGPNAVGLIVYITNDERRLFERLGVVLGQRSIFVQKLLGRSELERRRTLLRVAMGSPFPGEFARPEQVSFSIRQVEADRGEEAVDRALEASGYLRFGSRAVRCDAVEKLMLLDRRDEEVLVRQICALASCSRKDAVKIGRGLGLGDGLPKKQRRKHKKRPPAAT